MVEELNLNEGLNPQIPISYKPLPKDNFGVEQLKQNNEKIAKQIENWNNKPEVKEAGVKAGTIIEWNVWKNLGIMGIIFLLIFAVTVGVYGYTVYKDGTLIPKLICAPNVTLSSSCPAPHLNVTNTCGSCVCNNTYAPTIKLSCTNSS